MTSDRSIGPSPSSSIAAAVAWMMACELALRLFGFARTWRLLQKRVRRRPRDGTSTSVGDAASPDPTSSSGASGDPREASAPSTELLAARVDHANLHLAPIAVTCLSRSLALWALLRRHGFDPQLEIGVRKTTGRFEAHAWVEVDGHPVGEGPRVRQIYARLPLQDSPFLHVAADPR